MTRILDRITVLAAAGGTGGVIGALTHDSLMTWTGAAIAAVSALLSGMIAGYHRYRGARRIEDAADRDAQLEDIRGLTRAQVELELRIAKAEHDTIELGTQLQVVRCRFPLPDGRARCTDSTDAPTTP